MCLYTSDKNKELFLKRHKNKKKVVVWKILDCLNNSFATPYMGIKIEQAGWFKATGKPSKRCVREGGIHIYTTRQEARKLKQSLSPKNDNDDKQKLYDTSGNIYTILLKVVRCEALLKDLIAVGKDGDACFSKIWIPKKELKQCV